jgi:hypothetical protein
MPNNIAAELPVDNDGLFWCQIKADEVNLTTGLIDKDVAIINRNDVKAFIVAGTLDGDSLEKRTTDAIHTDLVFALLNVAGTPNYYIYPQGDVLLSRLIPAHRDAKVFVHFIAGNGDWHEVAETTVVVKRTATNG